MLSAIKELINPDVSIDFDSARRTLVVKESASDSKIKKLNITNLPDNVFAFTLDYQPGGQKNRMFKQLSCYVNVANSCGANKGCDLIMAWIDQEVLYVLIFDLKSDRPRVAETKKQLDNSELYFKYLLSMVEAHYGISAKVVVRKAVATTDSGSIRKGSVYKPNSGVRSSCGFHIEPVLVKSNQTAYVSLDQLMR